MPYLISQIRFTHYNTEISKAKSEKIRHLLKRFGIITIDKSMFSGLRYDFFALTLWMMVAITKQTINAAIIVRIRLTGPNLRRGSTYTGVTPSDIG